MVRFWLAAALLILSAPSAQAKLGIENIQACYGPFGPERKSLDLFPFDELTFRFIVTGAKADAEGKVDATVSTQVLDAAGRVLVENQYPVKGPLVLGGDSYSQSARLPMVEQSIPGKYAVKITVRDNVSEESAAFQRMITVKALAFKIVGFQFFRDSEGKIPAPAGGMLGEYLFFRLRVTGFDRSKGRINIQIAVQIFDADGKEVRTNPVRGDFRQDDATAVKKIGFWHFGDSFNLTRVGKFTLRFTATDLLTKKSTQFEVPIQVTAP